MEKKTLSQKQLEACGWPEGMDEETVEWLQAKIIKYLRLCPMPEWLIERNLSYEKDAPELWRKSPVLDWKFLALRRACGAVNAELVWRLHSREDK